MTMKDKSNLIWIDLEMTGLDTQRDYIIEIATIVTDKNLNILGEGPNLVVHQIDEVMNNMDDWNTNQHNKSGLVERIKNSTYTYTDAQAMTIEFLYKYIDHNKSPMCGNSICQDRRFMAKHMPDLESYFHYRNLDVSVFKELAKRWKPELIDGFKKKGKHEALADILESIEELKYYREHFIKV